MPLISITSQAQTSHVILLFAFCSPCRDEFDAKYVRALHTGRVRSVLVVFPQAPAGFTGVKAFKPAVDDSPWYTWFMKCDGAGVCPMLFISQNRVLVG